MWLAAGALLAVGILNCGVQHENDPAYALLYDFVEKEDPVVRTGAIMGLGLAYAGTQKEEVRPNSLNYGKVLLYVYLAAVKSFTGYLTMQMRRSSVCAPARCI